MCWVGRKVCFRSSKQGWAAGTNVMAACREDSLYGSAAITRDPAALQGGEAVGGLCHPIESTAQGQLSDCRSRHITRAVATGSRQRVRNRSRLVVLGEPLQ